ncbi:MAG: hypothetical protein DM484_27185 [Candidatus Methylumidiphilus alinenensis]|uniref:Uncharacterized protein n=1 Tax=Candidatus Methylumidiphilus alinenensis TaxID=2202197 RepID=A0A2W4SBM7_9GAMM|nr:MAG: hypothetical protein DM484_27185 [Candidatus Methylumidiphilus alinenensis]
MSNIIWDKDKILGIDADCLQNIMSNMESYNRPDARIGVRLGTTGEGVRPNYEIVLSFAYSSSCKPHELIEDKYNDENLSPVFSLEKIKQILNGVAA